MTCILASDQERHPGYLTSPSISGSTLVDHSAQLDCPRRVISDHLPVSDLSMRVLEPIASE
jgi:hypothetical protein